MDDIVKRIRQQSYFGPEPYEAADEIEQLRQRVQELEKGRDAAWKEAVEHVEAQQNIINELTAERDALKQQRDELLAAAEAIEIDAEECLDFDECTAMLVPIDTYHKLIEAIASVKEKQNDSD